MESILKAIKRKIPINPAVVISTNPMQRDWQLQKWEFKRGYRE